MSNKIVFLSRFINEFIGKGTKRKNSNNSIDNIARQINSVSKKQFEKKLVFTHDEILQAFSENGFLVSNNFDEEFCWEKFHNNTLLSKTYFINVKTANLRRLTLTNLAKHRDNWSDDTKLDVISLKAKVSDFWNNNKDILK